jgi:PLP dependent protein
MTLSERFTQINHLIKQTTLENNRLPSDVLLLAVSKQQSPEVITQAFELGLRDFGENYFQEAFKKITALKNLPLIWHFIGPIQSNKTQGIATNFTWVHSVDRLKIAEKLNEYRPSHLSPLNVCLQINLVGEKTKSGIAPEEAPELALAMNQLPHLKLRGLMSIPPPEKDPQKQYELFIKLTHLQEAMNQKLGLEMDTLSMGMTDDLVPAIQAGATIIRVGRAIFGERHLIY